jgi:DNA processing protein
VSVGVLLVEAAEYIGTGITAGCALEQNRDVFAVPGNVTNKNSWGPITLLKQGAKVVASWPDVWEELPAQVRLALTPAQAAESQPPGTASLFGEEGELTPQEKKDLRTSQGRRNYPPGTKSWSRLEPELSSSEIFAVLFELELAGRVRQLPGKNFVKTS